MTEHDDTDGKSVSSASHCVELYARSLYVDLTCVCALQAAWRVPGQYLVALRPETHASHVHRTIQRLRVRASRRGHQLDVLQTYSGALCGFLVRMSSDVLHLVRFFNVSVLDRGA